MTTFSTIAQLPLPENTDILVAEEAFGNYAQALDSLLIPQYSTIALRDSAMLSGKIEGQLCAVAGELQWWDGQQWWNSADARYINKGVDTTRTSTTTLATDPQLQVALKAGGSYQVDTWCSFTCATSGTVNAKFQFTSAGGFITGRTAYFGPSALTGAGLNVDDCNMLTRSAAMNIPDACGVSSSSSVLFLSGIYTATADDTLQFQWCQNVSSTSGLVLQARSHMEYRRIS